VLTSPERETRDMLDHDDYDDTKRYIYMHDSWSFWI
jgi:hypothetical protein